MWVTVWFDGSGSDEYVPLNTPLCDLTELFCGATKVELSGDDMERV